jgi:short-subunit dehydrogenase
MSHSTTKGTALITGASTGIGATYADRLARRGYDLILVARDEKLRAAAHVAVDVLPADLVTPSGRALVEQRLADDAAITVLVNNAGMSASGTLAEVDPARIEKMIELNVVTVARLAAAAARVFSARKYGIIINIASALALAPELFSGVYSGTKAFVLNLTQSMQQELAPFGVQVQVVLPGATRTEIWERAGTDTSRFPPDFMMEVDEMVDAALAGLDLGEVVTIPSLSDQGDFEAFTQMRLALRPNLSKSHAAVRYKTKTDTSP